MAKNNNLTDFLADTANHIRSKAGINDTTKINPQNFANIIDTMPMLAQEGATGSRYRKYTHSYTAGGDFINLFNPYNADYNLYFDDNTPTCVITILTVTIHTLAESGETGANDGGYALYCFSDNNEISNVLPVVEGKFADMTSARVFKVVYSDTLYWVASVGEGEPHIVQYGLAVSSDRNSGLSTNIDMEYQQLIMPVSNARFSAATCKALVESGV